MIAITNHNDPARWYSDIVCSQGTIHNPLLDNNQSAISPSAQTPNQTRALYFAPSPGTLLLSSSTRLSAIASAVACRTLSVSSILISLLPLVLSLASRSSSLSPRLNGSFSAIGLGSTVDSGCHLLVLAAPLPPPGAAAAAAAATSLGGSFGEALYASMSSTVSRNETFLPSFGLGDLEGGGGLKKLGLPPAGRCWMGAVVRQSLRVPYTSFGKFLESEVTYCRRC